MVLCGLGLGSTALHFDWLFFSVMVSICGKEKFLPLLRFYFIYVNVLLQPLCLPCTDARMVSGATGTGITIVSRHVVLRSNQGLLGEQPVLLPMLSVLFPAI